MANKKKNTKTTSFSSISSLSSQNLNHVERKKITENDVKDIQNKVFNAINNLELEKSLDKWLKEHEKKNQIIQRDLSILKNNTNEYLDSFLILGYTMEGERVVIQDFKTPKDRDAIVEFLKTIFLKQQHEGFLDE